MLMGNIGGAGETIIPRTLQQRSPRSTTGLGWTRSGGWHGETRCGEGEAWGAGRLL